MFEGNLMEVLRKLTLTCDVCAVSVAIVDVHSPR